MRQHPVGIRCKECAREQRLPTYQVSASYFVRGTLAAVAVGVAGLVGLTLIFNFFPGLGIFFFILMGLLGYVVGEGVGTAVNQRRGRPYQYMALGGALIATAPFAIAGLLSFSIAGALNIVGVGIALSVAWSRRAP